MAIVVVFTAARATAAGRTRGAAARLSPVRRRLCFVWKRLPLGPAADSYYWRGRSAAPVIYFDTSIFLDKVVNASSNGTNASNASYASPEPEPSQKTRERRYISTMHNTSWSNGLDEIGVF